MQKIWLLLAACFCLLTPAQAQPKWKNIVPAAYAALDAEVADSIASRRAEAADIRLRMEVLMDKLGFQSRRELIFGPNDVYFEEGMYTHFYKAPMTIQANLDRDSQMIRFEILHGRLYYSDQALSRWLGLQKTLTDHPGRQDMGRWSRRFQESPPATPPQNDADYRAWVAQELVCELAETLKPKPYEERTEEVRHFDPKIENDSFEYRYEMGNDWKLPYGPDKIWASFPTNGQYAFQREEAIPGVGYVFFPAGAGTHISRYWFNHDYEVLARWCSTTGQILYTAGRFEDDKKIFYNLPDNYFQPGQVYRLEVLVAPKRQPPGQSAEDACWRSFRKGVSRFLPNEAILPGEIKITELYFRTSRYSVREKMEQMRGTLDWQQGAIRYETDEPFDRIETNGTPHSMPLIRLGVYHLPFLNLYNTLDDKDLFYYLTVPTVEPLAGRPLDQLAVAERDNTWRAGFVRQTELGEPEEYFKVPRERTKAYSLPGGYVAPVYSYSFTHDSMVTSVPVPFITKADFEAGQAPEPGRVQCTYWVGEWSALQATARLHQAQIRRRMEERAQFFYQLEQRQAQRSGTPMTVTLEGLRQDEWNNLPKPVRLLLDSAWPESIQGNFTLIYNRYYPLTTLRTTELLLTF